MDIAQLIDHAVLHPTATDQDVIKEANIAKKHKVASLCVKPCHVSLAHDLLADSNVVVCTVIGFPHGSQTIETKWSACKQAISEGAEELDMVINIAKAKAHDWGYIEKEINTINQQCQASNKIIKVIFETDYIDDEESIKMLCEICNKVGVHFVKTSTGFGFKKHTSGLYHYEGALEQIIIWMRKYTRSDIGIKASGGIRTLEKIRKFVKLGVNRIGTSSTETILNH